jgi:hypothetical protein
LLHTLKAIAIKVPRLAHKQTRQVTAVAPSKLETVELIFQLPAQLLAILLKNKPMLAVQKILA